tara:strand:- start:30142 stop:30672 length:531 start_codon:yes stop_codon:yes gene_type:complete
MLSELQSFLGHFFWFGGDAPVNAEHGEYIISLVVLSFVIATLGSFVALRLATDIYKAPTEKMKTFLHLCGAIAFGAGIWSTHFIGMLAYDMEKAHRYNLWMTLVSMLIAEDPTDQWKAAAHKLKGAAGYVGAEQMKTLCAHAQNMEAANTEERTRTYEKIEQSYNAVRHFLEERSA